jgi:hypothetical protein
MSKKGAAFVALLEGDTIATIIKVTRVASRSA